MKTYAIAIAHEDGLHLNVVRTKNVGTAIKVYMEDLGYIMESVENVTDIDEIIYILSGECSVFIKYCLVEITED